MLLRDLYRPNRARKNHRVSSLLFGLLSIAMITSCSIEPQGGKDDDGGGGSSNSLSGKKFTDEEYLCEPESQYSESEGDAEEASYLSLLADPTYKSDVEKIIKANCVSCHNPNGNEPDLTTYAGVSDAADSSLAELEAKTMPLAAPLEEASISIFREWVEAGAPEGGDNSKNEGNQSGDAIPGNCGNSGDATPNNGVDESGDDESGESDDDEDGEGSEEENDENGDDEEEEEEEEEPAPKLVNYIDDIKPLLDSNCATAGCHANGGTNPNLSNFSSAASAAASSNAAIISGSMPRNAPDFNANQKALFQKWIDDGTSETGVAP